VGPHDKLKLLDVWRGVRFHVVISRMDDVRNREATAEDSPLVVSILHSAFAEYEHLYTAQAFAATVLDEERVRKRLDEGPAWLALRGGRAVGTVSLVFRHEGYKAFGFVRTEDGPHHSAGRRCSQWRSV
jgi:hypothetical protein